VRSGRAAGVALALGAGVLVPAAPSAAAPPGELLHDGPVVVAPDFEGEVAVGGDGALWSVDRATATVTRFTLADEVSTYAIPSGDVGKHIAAAPNGDLWFTTDTTVGRITTAGVVTELPVFDELAAQPGDIVVAPDGNVWWTLFNAAHLGRTTPAGVSELVPLPVQSTSQFITVEADGTIWSMTFGGGFLIRTTPAGVSTFRALGVSSVVAGWSHGVVVTFSDGAHIVDDDELDVGPVFSPALAYAYPDTIRVGADDRLWMSGGAGTIAVDEHGVVQDFGGVGSPVPLPDGTVIASSRPTATTQRVVRLHDFDEVPLVHLELPQGLLFEGDVVPMRATASGATDPAGGTMTFHRSICCHFASPDDPGEITFADVAVVLGPDGVGEATTTIPPEVPEFVHFGAVADYDAPGGQQGNVSLGAGNEISQEPSLELRFTSDAYVVLLHRVIEQGSVRGQWVSLLRAGRARSAVAAGLAGSEERRTVLTRELYDRLLHRPADAGGFAAFTTQLRNGVRLQDIEAFMVGSGEYGALHGSTDAGFVAAAYADLFGRPADAGGAAFWTSRLAGGMARTSVAAAFLDSPEGRGLIVRQAYDEALGRAPDPGGLAFWAERVRLGMPVETLLVSLVGSDEFYARSHHPHL
jgi:sugar lactone lactonase YvrE